MSGSFSQQLEDLLNPLPKFLDPEDDGDEETKARVIDRFNEEEEEVDEDGVGLSALRKNTDVLLSDTDRRYVGRAVSRKELMRDMEEDEDDDDDDDDDDEDEEGEEEDEDAVEEEEEEDEEQEEGAGERQESEDDLNNDDKDLDNSDVTFSKGIDFCKLTEGMDDLGVSEEDDDDEEEGSEEEEEEESDEDDMEEDEHAESTVRTFSQDKLDEEMEKGQAVKNQLALWDQLLEGRIKMQKAVVTANQLPQPLTFPQFRKDVEFAGALKNSHKALKALQRSLLELHDQLLFQNPDTKAICMGESDDEMISDDDKICEERVLPKRKLEMAEYPDFMAKRFAAFAPYQNATLQKWHDKTRLTMGKSSKSFEAFDRNIVTQIDHVLMDKERLIRRTQTRRSEYPVMGKKEKVALTTESKIVEGEDPEPQLKANAHLKDLDEDVFDDDDFYHQLLRELIERKTSAADPNDQVAMGKQWLAIQKLRSKIKKKVDTKASKGRKVRFHIHSKLVNFMAPIDHSAMSDEARNELYRGLFGQNSAVRE